MCDESNTQLVRSQAIRQIAVYNMTFRNVDEIFINQNISTATVTEHSYQVSFFINGSVISEKNTFIYFPVWYYDKKK